MQPLVLTGCYLTLVEMFWIVIIIFNRSIGIVNNLLQIPSYPQRGDFVQVDSHDSVVFLKSLLVLA